MSDQRNVLVPLFVALWIAALIAVVAPVDACAAELEGQEVVVGLKPAAPFVMRDDTGKWRGITIDLWERVARNLGLTYTYAEYDLQGLLSAVGDRSVDVGLGALTVTAEREQHVDFSHPFFRSGLAIAVTVEHRPLIVRILDRLISVAFLKALAGLAAALFVAGGIVWLLERRKNNEHFGGGGLRGLGEGIWWAGVTMTTVGYGDKAPKTVGGRLVALVWMYISVITISGFTAAIATSLTIDEISSRISGPQDLPGKSVATVAGSTSETYLTTRGVRAVSFDSATAALLALANNRVDAVVYDEPLLRYYLLQGGYRNVRILPGDFNPQSYSFALVQDSPLREAVNRELLHVVSQPEWADVLARYLGARTE